MEHITAQMSQQDLMEVLASAGQRSGRRSAVHQGGGDAFMQVIQNMVDQMLSGENDEKSSDLSGQNAMDPALLAGFAGMLFSMANTSLQDWSDGDSTQQMDKLLQQMTSQMSGGNRMNTVPDAVRQLLLQSASPATAQAVAQILSGELGPQTQQNVSQESTQSAAVPPVQTEAVMAQAAQTTQPTRAESQTATRTFLQTIGAESKTSEGETLSNEATILSARSASTEGGSDSLFAGQQRFGSAVAQARQALENQSRKGVKQTDTNAEAAQLSVEAQKLQLQGASAKLAEANTAMETPKLLDQLTDGLTQELSQGKGEFTMKLKPEALGEITVKLTEKDGKMVLNITTASAQTAKLLNAELPALRETMRPMQVEVHEAVSQTGQSNQAQMQFNMSNQQFANQQKAFAWQQEKPYYAGSNDTELAEESEPTTGEKVSTGLNRYV